ncbi:GDP-mannose 4,6-dehydratase [Candidatus Micrarchaeota archaeon]|nr:GDP-mannose 4,6-dehydratase [Candidatus Micrarchaeota archaeon]
MTKYLITGASGFIGSTFIEFLLRERKEAEIIGVGQSGARKDIDYKKIDLTDFSKTKEFIEKAKPNYIFHFAGAPGADEWEKLIDGNIKTTLSILEGAAATQGRAQEMKIFVIGSASEYGNPTQLPIKEDASVFPASRYGISMVCRTEIARGFASRGLQIFIGRLFNPIGPGLDEKYAAGSFAKQIKTIKEGKQKNQSEIFIGDPQVKRDFVDMDDACKAFLAIVEKGKSGEIYNICSGKSYKMEELLNFMLKEAKINPKINVDSSKMRNNQIREIKGSTEKISKDTGWVAKISLEESAKRMLV